MARKTVNVKELLEYANIQLARTDEDATREFKIGICVLLGKALDLSGNYNGFMFIDPDDSKCDTLGFYSRKYF